MMRAKALITNFCNDWNSTGGSAEPWTPFLSAPVCIILKLSKYGYCAKRQCLWDDDIFLLKYLYLLNYLTFYGGEYQFFVFNKLNSAYSGVGEYHFWDKCLPPLSIWKNGGKWIKRAMKMLLMSKKSWTHFIK